MSNEDTKSEDCPSCGKTCKNKQGVRIHHKQKHGEPLPNRTCKRCGDDFYDPDSQRVYCEECSEFSQYSSMPDSVDMSVREWVELTKHERHYIRNKDSEKERVESNKLERVEWVKDEFLKEATCSECGFEDSRAIEFHHTSENELDESPYRMARNMRSKEIIREEIMRGEFLCSNCHMIEHHENRFY